MKWRFVVFMAALVFTSVGQASAQTRIVTGRVVDSLTGDPVSAGQVSVQGTTVGTTIKDDGTFTLAVPARDVTLSLRSIGFKRRDVTVPTSQSSLEAKLERDYFQLEAIVVTGQATGVERRNLANAVATVSAEQLIKSTTTTVDQALNGKIAGAQILTNSGAPGNGMQVRLRGIASVLGNGVPLWVVDGVVINNMEIGSGLNQVTRGGGQSCNASATACGTQDQVVNRASDLNPADIENVEVLKGASAAAIYGSKANAGVILVTTKRGRVGAPQFTVSQRIGKSAILRRFGPFRRFSTLAEAQGAFGVPRPLVDFQANTYYDHEMEVFGEKPLSYETDASISGGTETTRYFASGLVKRDGGINVRTGYEKQSLRLNLDQQVGSRLSFSLSSNGIHTFREPGFNNNDNTEVGMFWALIGTPTWIDLRMQCPDGSRARPGTVCENGTWPLNPYSNSNVLQTATLGIAQENVWRTINAGRMDLSIINSASQTLKLIGSGGTDFFAKRDFVFTGTDLEFEPVDGFTGTVVHGSTFVNQMNASGNLVHTLKPASGAFRATTQIGVSYEKRTFNYAQIWSRNLVTGVASVDQATSQTIQQTRNRVQDAGYFAQEEFLTLGERLLLTAGIRADQSSTNSDAKKLFFYPKASASYRFGRFLGILDEWKLRAAYGQSGNQPQYGDKFSPLCSGQFEGIPTISVGATGCNTVISPLFPERQAEAEAGLDATLFSGRANLEVTGYQRLIKDLLINQNLVPSTGYSQARFNGATLRTRGLEAALNLVPLQSNAIQWQARTTFSLDRNRLTYLPVPPFTASGSYQFGAARFIQDSSATQVYGNDTLNGVIIQRKIGDITPTFTVGISNDIKVKALSLNMLWSWQKGGMVGNLSIFGSDAARTSRDYTEPCVPGDCLPGETLGAQRNRMLSRVSANYVQDQSFVKLREATLTLELPRSYTNKLWSGIRFAKLSVSGRNLLWFTKYNGVDPEVANNGSRNLRIGFDDVGPYPPSRSFFFGIDLGF